MKRVISIIVATCSITAFASETKLQMQIHKNKVDTYRAELTKIVRKCVFIKKRQDDGALKRFAYKCPLQVLNTLVQEFDHPADHIPKIFNDILQARLNQPCTAHNERLSPLPKTGNDAADVNIPAKSKKLERAEQKAQTEAQHAKNRAKKKDKKLKRHQAEQALKAQEALATQQIEDAKKEEQRRQEQIRLAKRTENEKIKASDEFRRNFMQRAFIRTWRRYTQQEKAIKKQQAIAAQEAQIMINELTQRDNVNRMLAQIETNLQNLNVKP